MALQVQVGAGIATNSCAGCSTLEIGLGAPQVQAQALAAEPREPRASECELQRSDSLESMDEVEGGGLLAEMRAYLEAQREVLASGAEFDVWVDALAQPQLFRELGRAVRLAADSEGVDTEEVVRGLLAAMDASFFTDVVDVEELCALLSALEAEDEDTWLLHGVVNALQQWDKVRFMLVFEAHVTDSPFDEEAVPPESVAEMFVQVGQPSDEASADALRGAAGALARHAAGPKSTLSLDQLAGLVGAVSRAWHGVVHA